MKPTVEKEIFCRGTPRKCGREYGEQAREEIRREVEFSAPGFKELSGPDHFLRCAELSLQTYAPEILDELTGVAEGAGVDIPALLFLNVWNSFDDAEERCTPFLLRQSDRGPVAAKNNDGPERERFRAPFILRKVEPDHGLPFLQVTYAGWLSGLDMMNSAGLVNTHGSVGSLFPRGGNRLDIRLRMYRLMRHCRTVPELLSGLEAVPLTGKGFSIMAGDAEGQNAVIDAAVPEIIISGRDVDHAFSTNLYIAPELDGRDGRTPAGRIHNRGRRRFLQDFFAGHTLRSVGELQALMRTHGEFAPCRHVPLCPSSTFWSMIALPAERKILLASGAPCETEYREYEV